jgi:deazaflavin-dependent oxidoreductase (nitroreductase family)
MYVDGKYIAERRLNPFVRSLQGGRVLSALELPFFMLLPPFGFGVITTIGRRTGKRRRKCVRTIRRGDKVYVVSIGGAEAAWLKNVRANPTVSLRIRGGTYSGVIRELRDASERHNAMAAYCETVNLADYAECAVHRRGRPTRSKIMELHRAWFEGGIPLVIELIE